MPKRLALVAVVFVGLACTATRSEVTASAPHHPEVLTRPLNRTTTTSTTTTTTEPPTTTTTAPATTTTSTDVVSSTEGEVSAAAIDGGGDVETAVHAWFDRGGLFGQAWRVSDCESTHDPTAVGGNNYGLFQISSVHADAFEQVTGVPFRSGWSDPNLNAQYARHLYDESGGWGPWGCRWAA